MLGRRVDGPIRLRRPLLFQSGFVSFKSRLHQVWIKTRVGLLKFSNRGRNLDQPARRSRFQDANRAGDKKSVATSGISPGTVVHQDGRCVDLLGQANRLQLSEIDVERRIEPGRRLKLHPNGQ